MAGDRAAQPLFKELDVLGGEASAQLIRQLADLRQPARIPGPLPLGQPAARNAHEQEDKAQFDLLADDSGRAEPYVRRKSSCPSRPHSAMAARANQEHYRSCLPELFASRRSR